MTMINTAEDLKSALREGPYVSGGYPIFFICEDASVLSYDAVSQNVRHVLAAIRHDDDPQWRVIVADINWEDADLICDHTGISIPAAYSE